MLRQTTRAHFPSKQESHSSTTLRRSATRVVRQFGHRQAVTDHLTLMAIERVARVQHELLSCRCYSTNKHSTVHSYALAASALHAPLNCHPTLTPVSLSTGFSSIALALVSKMPRILPAEISMPVTVQLLYLQLPFFVHILTPILR